MNRLYKKFKINIPKNIITLYCSQRNLLLIKNKYQSRLIKLKTKILFYTKSVIIVTNISSTFNYKDLKKGLKINQGTTIFLIKQSIIELTIINFIVKLVIIGTGYKLLLKSNIDQNVFQLKIGCSHNLFIKIPSFILVKKIKLTKIFFFGCFYYELTQIISKVKSLKMPDPYKGKGIRYFNEKIKLKKGKKNN